jgi:hypothetical protein
MTHAGEPATELVGVMSPRNGRLPHSQGAFRMSVTHWPLREAEASGPVFRDDTGASFPKGAAGVYRLKRDSRPNRRQLWMRNAGDAKGMHGSVLHPDGSYRRDHLTEAANRTTNRRERDADYLARHPEQGGRRDSRHHGENDVYPLFEVEPALSIINISSEGAGLDGINAGRVAREVEAAIQDTMFSSHLSRQSVALLDKANDRLVNHFDAHPLSGLAHNVGASKTLLKMAEEGEEGKTVGYITDCEIYQSPPPPAPPHPNAGEKYQWSCHGFDLFGNITEEVFDFWHPKRPGSVVTAAAADATGNEAGQEATQEQPLLSQHAWHPLGCSHRGGTGACCRWVIQVNGCHLPTQRFLGTVDASVDINYHHKYTFSSSSWLPPPSHTPRTSGSYLVPPTLATTALVATLADTLLDFTLIGFQMANRTRVVYSRCTLRVHVLACTCYFVSSTG